MALWQATIVENALKRLAALNKPFKYVGALAALCPQGSQSRRQATSCAKRGATFEATCFGVLARTRGRVCVCLCAEGGTPQLGVWAWDTVGLRSRARVRNAKAWPGRAVTCMISQNTGGATHTAHTCFWDAETDGTSTCPPRSQLSLPANLPYGRL